MLAEAYGWTPDVVADMTLPQVHVYLMERKAGNQSKHNSLAERRAWLKANRQRITIMAFQGGEAFVDLTMNDKAFRAGVSKNSGIMSKLGGKMATIGKAGAAAFAAIGAGIAATTAVSGRFEQTMARVRALTGANDKQFSELEEAAKSLGRSTVFSASEAAKGMSFFALAGFDANKIISSMPATLDLAAAGQLELGTASDIVAKIMAGMGLEAKDLGGTVDVLTKAFTTSNTDLMQLGDAMKFVGPIGKQTGRGIEELTAAIQVMSNAGIQGGMAGTSLRMILLRLAGGVPQAKRALDGLGVATADATGASRPLADIIDDLNAKTANMTTNQKTAVLAQIAGARSVAALSEMMARGGDEMRRFQTNLENSGGTAQRIADIQLDTLFGSLTLLKSVMEGLAIEVGDVFGPAIRAGADAISVLGAAAIDIVANSGLAEWFSDLSKTIVSNMENVMFAGQVLAVGVDNFGIVLQSAFVGAGLAVVTFSLDMAHAFEAIAFALAQSVVWFVSWVNTARVNFVDNWSNILGSALAILQNWGRNADTFLGNISDNISARWDVIKGIFRGELVEFNPKSLTDGFTEVTDTLENLNLELPTFELSSLPDREKSQVEKDMEALKDELNTALELSLEAKVTGDAEKKVDELRKKLDAKAAEDAAVKAGTGGEGSVAAQAEFVGLTDVWDKISSTTATQVTTDEKALDVAQQQLAQQKLANEKAERLNTFLIEQQFSAPPPEAMKTEGR